MTSILQVYSFCIKEQDQKSTDAIDKLTEDIDIFGFEAIKRLHHVVQYIMLQ